jgi:hypothetical protein
MSKIRTAVRSFLGENTSYILATTYGPSVGMKFAEKPDDFLPLVGELKKYSPHDIVQELDVMSREGLLTCDPIVYHGCGIENRFTLAAHLLQAT